jgi:hypothetical protein
MLGYRLIDSLIAESSLPAHIEFLSIATVVKLWSATPYLRERIRQIPAVRTIRSRTEFKNALKGLLDARSARLLTFPQFEAAFKSTTCMLCWISDSKATSLPLLHCHRLCQSCVDYHQDFLPLKVDLERTPEISPAKADLAKEVFGLDIQELEHIAVAHLRFKLTPD